MRRLQKAALVVGAALTVQTACVIGAASAPLTVAGPTPESMRSRDGDLSSPIPDRENSTEQHFSPVRALTAQNIHRLGLAWALDLPGEHTLEAVPTVVNGTIFFTGQASKVYAVDAVTGILKWKYDPEVWKQDRRRLRLLFAANRGVAYWRGRVFVCTFDGRLIALDAESGKPLWSVQTFDPATRHYSTGAPRAFNGKIVIGNGGADFGERGFITAYSADTGAQLWRFYTVPGSPEQNKGDGVMEMAAKTWSGEYWKSGTGGTVWDGMTYDPDLNRLYIGVGNSGPYNPSVRSPGNGDNLFLTSIVALDADTGAYIWHYQANPREAWDYKATANMIMADLQISGVMHKVLMQAPTNGFFYVLDRITGKLLSAEKLGKVSWADHIDITTGRPVESPNIRYETGQVEIWPGPWGAHNWQPMSFDPITKLVYIPYQQVGAKFSIDPNAPLGGMAFAPILASPEDGKGKLIAWDPIEQKPRWSIDRSALWNGGVLSTAGGLVFQGLEDGTFNAYDASDGKKLWSFDAKLGIIAAPVSFSVGGTQYVSILVGYGGATALQSTYYKGGWKYNAQPRRLLTFKIGGHASLPTTLPRNFGVIALDEENLLIDETAAVRGAAAYAGKGCSLCHGDKLVSTGIPAPDLRESSVAVNLDSFSKILRSDVLARNGMPQFDDLTDREISDLFMYIRTRARETLGKRSGSIDDSSAAVHF